MIYSRHADTKASDTKALLYPCCTSCAVLCCAVLCCAVSVPGLQRVQQLLYINNTRKKTH